MDSDDDYQSFFHPEEPSPQPQYRRLKRLKKSDANPVKELLPDPVEDPLLFSGVDFARLEALEKDSEIPELDGTCLGEETNLSQESLSQGVDTEDGVGLECGLDEVVKMSKKVLEFDDHVPRGDANGVEGEKGFEQEHNVKGGSGKGDLFEEKEGKKKKKKNRVKNQSVADSNRNAGRPNKRREEKERRAYLEELHAESQKLLRETRNASFKPIPAVQKPISSVLEKIRKRKLEISKKAAIADNTNGLLAGNYKPTDKLMELDASDKGNDGENVAVIAEEIVAPSADGGCSLSASDVDGCTDHAKQMHHDNDANKLLPEDESIPAFRAPANDTEDLFDDSEPNSAPAEPNDEQLHSSSEDDSGPSLLPMNLQFDSVPMDDSSSDEEDGQENVDPSGNTESASSPIGDLVKGFVDDEAEEENDSDNDLNCFQENAEDEDIEDFEELNDIIATDYKERPVDNERRNELHQKWLEQQDAAGTDNIMQKLRCGSGQRDTLLEEEEPETDEKDEEFDDDDDDEAREDSTLQNSVQMNTKKAKQIILQLITDKEDAYLSDDDDHDKKRHAQYLIRKEENATVVPPADDENSREVFGLIKKLNIESDQKKKPKQLSFLESVLKGGNCNSSSKPSFLGRATSHPILSSHRQGSGTVRSFIFGRDDSNSRSSFSISEDSYDTVSQERRQTKTVTVKYSSSQTKFTSRTRNNAAETVSGTSLLEILKRSSVHSQLYNPDNAVDLTKSIFSFKVPKNPMKIEERN